MGRGKCAGVPESITVARMWTEDFLEPAKVQYGDWNGTVSGDDVDMTDACEFFGIDQERYRLLAIDINIYGGRQSLKACGIPIAWTFRELQAFTDAGKAIRTRVLKTIEFDPTTSFDTNPPPPLALPVVSGTEYLAFGFKRLHIRLVSRNLPKGAELLLEHPEEGDEGFVAED